MRGLAVEHDPNGHAALVGEALAERGFEIEIFRVVADPEDPRSHKPFPDPAGYDLVMVLGAIWSVYDKTTIGTWIDREIDFVRRVHDAGQPVLGICFGGQVLSAALGGTVSRAPAAEIGWFPLESDHPEGLSPGPWFQWHYDRFSVPAGAAEVARSASGPQAFRQGRSLGVQFHPELDSALLATWLDFAAADLAAAGVNAEALAAETARVGPAAGRRTQRLVDWFLDDVAGL